MATLAEQVRQMMDVLELVDPEAAARIKGGSPSRPINVPVPQPITQYVEPAAPQARKAVPKKAVKPVRTPEIQAMNPESSPLRLNLAEDSLIKGIIYSEILGKPVSRRSRRGRQ